MKSLLLLALGLARTVVLGARIEAERIVVSVRPYKREQRRCPVCGRACDFYDMANRGAPRLWRAMDLARSACYLEYAPCRVRCPEHGVRTEAVPWARHGARFTRDFEDWVAWLAVRCTASAVSELARVEWHRVGGVCRRVYAELEAARGASRFDGVRRIGIDETSYKKGHKYVTVVVDHDRGCLIWAHEGTGKDVLNLFLDELTREQRRAIEVVTADGARWIRQLVKRRCPNARWVMDPFHVVQWMNDALDAVRCEEWNAARAAARAARAIPVLPEVGSMITVPGVSSPFASPSSSMALATRSFTEPAGLKYSSLASSLASRPSAASMWVSSSSGVWPIS